MDRHAFQHRLDSLMLRGYRLACLVLACFFLGLFILRLVWIRQHLRTELMTEAAVFGALFAGLAFVVGRMRPEQRKVEAMGLGIVGAGALNALALHLILRDNWQTTNFMVAAVGTGLAFRRTPPFLAAEAMVFGAWILAAFVYLPHPMLHWILGMLSALSVGGTAHLFLKRLLTELDQLNAHEHDMIQEREHLIRDMQSALDNVKTLSGLIPICAQCKKVRDDRGFWQHVEHYVSTRTEADFTHSLCPACLEETRRDFGLPPRTAPTQGKV